MTSINGALAYLKTPYPHWTRREKRSKLGCLNPVVATGLYTLHATQRHVSRTQTGQDPFLHVTRQVLLPVWMGPKSVHTTLSTARPGVQSTPDCQQL